MALLADDDARYLREAFAALQADVTLAVVTRERSRLVLPGAAAADEPEGDADTEVREIVDEVAAASPRLHVQPIDVGADRERADAITGGRTPAIVFQAEHAKGRLRYFGLPAGYEMSTLISTLLDLGAGEPMVPPEVAAGLAALPEPVHIQVFVTPSCPHCPRMARAAYQLAMASERITADVVEVTEFVDLAERYQVRGVPMTVINERETLLGAVPAGQLLAAVHKAGGGQLGGDGGAGNGQANGEPAA